MGWKLDRGRSLIGALATLGSYGLICVVLQFEKISEVVALRQISIIMVIFWGCWKLDEPFGFKRLIAGIMIIFGIRVFVIALEIHLIQDQIRNLGMKMM